MVTSKAELAFRRLREEAELCPRLGFILGSGFQEVVEGFEILVEIPDRRVAGFPVPKVAGHRSVVMACRLTREAEVKKLRTPRVSRARHRKKTDCDVAGTGPKVLACLRISDDEG